MKPRCIILFSVLQWLKLKWRWYTYVFYKTSLAFCEFRMGGVLWRNKLTVQGVAFWGEGQERWCVLGVRSEMWVDSSLGFRSLCWRTPAVVEPELKLNNKTFDEQLRLTGIQVLHWTSVNLQVYRMNCILTKRRKTDSCYNKTNSGIPYWWRNRTWKMKQAFFKLFYYLK